MEPLCGLWIDGDGRAHLSLACADGARKEQVEPFRPFAWLAVPPGGEAGPPLPAGVTIERLKGEGVFTALAHAGSPIAYDALLALAKATSIAVDA
ncbi:MAG: DNA polymerase, partial [Verrucomicrobiota bacterium]